jgi:hypothetical protein
MPAKKSQSPTRFVESEATSAKARFLYLGAFQLVRRKDELNNSKPTRSGSKSSYK